MAPESASIFFGATQILIVGCIVYAIWVKFTGRESKPTSWFRKTAKDALQIFIVMEIVLWITMFINAGGNLDDTLDGYIYLWGMTHFTGIIFIPSVLTFLIMTPIIIMQSRTERKF